METTSNTYYHDKQLWSQCMCDENFIQNKI